MNKFKILVVDDTVPILTMLKLMLERKGYEVTVKDNTNELEQALTELSPDLLVMDVLLSGVDGRDICMDLRKNNAFAAMPIIMISALHDAEPSCLAAGAQYFLSKPFNMVQFHLIITAAIASTKVDS